MINAAIKMNNRMLIVRKVKIRLKNDFRFSIIGFLLVYNLQNMNFVKQGFFQFIIYAKNYIQSSFIYDKLCSAI